MEHYQQIQPAHTTTLTRTIHTTTPPPDTEGQPWYDGCTAYLSENDNTQQGLRDPDNQTTSYRCRHEEDPPPTHSNLHRDYLRIFRSNENYQNDQRSNQYKTIAHTGTPHPSPPLHSPTPMKWPTSRTASPTSSSNDIAKEAAQHHLRSRDHRYNSPNHHNMAIDQSYRKWFKKAISRRHYSFGEATEYYTRWNEDPTHFPNGPHPEIGSRAPLTHDDFRSDAILSGPTSIRAHTPSPVLQLGRGIRHRPTLQQLRTKIRGSNYRGARRHFGNPRQRRSDDHSDQTTPSH